LHIDATFNNTKVLFADKLGNTLFWGSAGAMVSGELKREPVCGFQGWRYNRQQSGCPRVKDADVLF